MPSGAGPGVWRAKDVIVEASGKGMAKRMKRGFLDGWVNGIPLSPSLRSGHPRMRHNAQLLKMLRGSRTG